MSLEDKLAKLYEYDSDIEGGERHKKDWINHASDLLRESFPAPSESAKYTMELADVLIALVQPYGGTGIEDQRQRFVALIQSYGDEMFERGKIQGRYAREADKVEDNL